MPVAPAGSNAWPYDGGLGFDVRTNIWRLPSFKTDRRLSRVRWLGAGCSTSPESSITVFPSIRIPHVSTKSVPIEDVDTYFK